MRAHHRRATGTCAADQSNVERERKFISVTNSLIRIYTVFVCRICTAVFSFSFSSCHHQNPINAL